MRACTTQEFRVNTPQVVKIYTVPIQPIQDINWLSPLLLFGNLSSYAEPGIASLKKDNRVLPKAIYHILARDRSRLTCAPGTPDRHFPVLERRIGAR